MSVMTVDKNLIDRYYKYLNIPAGKSVPISRIRNATKTWKTRNRHPVEFHVKEAVKHHKAAAASHTAAAKVHEKAAAKMSPALKKRYKINLSK